MGEVHNFCVYILRSLSSKKPYIGQTDNFNRRFSEHQMGKHPATRNRGPWEVLYIISCRDRKEAVALERKLKGMKRPDRVISFAEKLVQSVPTQEVSGRSLVRLSGGDSRRDSSSAHQKGK